MSKVISFGSRQPVEVVTQDAQWAKTAEKFAAAAEEVRQGILEGRMVTVVLVSEDVNKNCDFQNFCDAEPMRLIGFLEYQKHVVLSAMADNTEIIDES